MASGASRTSAISAHVPALPLEVDLLIAEAKRRARRRRLLLGLVVVTVSGAVATAFAVGGSERPRPVLGGMPACRSSQLRLSAGGSGVAAGTYSRVFTLVNDSNRSCSLHGGWPRLRLVLWDGRRLTPRVRLLRYFSSGVPNHPLRPRPIPLRPRAAGSFILLDQDWNYEANTACWRVRTMFVAPPGVHGWLSVPNGVGYCAPLLVPPLVAGKSPPYP